MSLIKSLVITAILGLTNTIAAAQSTHSAADRVTPAMRDEAVEMLRGALNSTERWPKVHAAEALLRLDYRAGITERFKKELATHGQEPTYRIGIWRVLALASTTQDEKDAWIGRIRGAFLDKDSPDRVNAAETLGKLRYAGTPAEREALSTTSVDEPDIFTSMCRWVLANDGSPETEARLIELLSTSDAGARLGTAYALRYRGEISEQGWRLLALAANRESAESEAYPYMMSAAVVLGPDGQYQLFKDRLLDLANSGNKDARYELCRALAVRGDGNDIKLLHHLMADDEDPDVRIAAANALLRIDRRVARGMHALDWGVIAVYLLAMVAVGWYYSRQNTSTDDYLLGGRNMTSWTVGLSLFATLLSTLSYLFVPGEMIKHGPMILTQLTMYPLIFLVVGWFLIPHFMKLRVTSAYEILETRLGMGVRLLGSTIFLLLRLLWMAVIIYATTDKVLVPLLGLSPQSTPWICVVLGTITVFYTSLGGLRAVVLTDVVQTAILFGGVILAIVTITYSLGGVGAWWPDHWAQTWDKPVWFDPNARVSFLGASIGVFFWWVCTAGSDQMAIQRYLATRDVKAARRAFAFTMASDALVCLFLASLGFALLAYFQTNPHLVPDGYTIETGADKLFPKYIIFGLPVGITGLVLAGLLAAAMSSLSSGINSSCSVITVDFLDRFRKRTDTELNHVRIAKYTSVAVGAVVVGLSFYVSVVPGNLLEVVYKVVNLFTGPLFVLFFIAMFVPWSTPIGAWTAAACSAAVAIAIAYWEPITGNQGISFLWITPLSLATGIVTGTLVSLVTPELKGTAASGSHL